MCLGLTACGAGGSGTAENSTDISDELTYTDSTKLEYAQKFTIDNYEGGYSLITITDGGRFLVVPEDKEAPEDLAKDITVLQQPFRIYIWWLRRSWTCSYPWTPWTVFASAAPKPTAGISTRRRQPWRMATFSMPGKYSAAGL